MQENREAKQGSPSACRVVSFVGNGSTHQCLLERPRKLDVGQSDVGLLKQMLTSDAEDGGDRPLEQPVATCSAKI